VADLKKMWEPGAQGRITRWNQVRSEWPAQPLMLFGPGADSGTFDYFTEAVNGKAKASRGDYTASEDDNVLVQGVENNRNALGYFGFAYYVAHKDKMRAVPVVNPKGQAIVPSIEAVNDGTYQPLSRPLFIYVRESAAQRSELREFVQFYLTQGGELAREVGYVPLPAQAYQLALKHFKDGKLGTVFGGVPEVGITIDELLVRYIEALVYQALAENMASEQSARMVAMKSATDNAGNVIAELKLVYNKTRQAGITKELSEIVAGAAAV
jgi:phosphate transport system substrate-binding protein